MARDSLKVPVIRVKGGVEKTDYHKESNPEKKQKILLALYRAPAGFTFHFDKLKAFLNGTWEPPVRPGAENAQLPHGELIKAPRQAAAVWV